MADYPINDQMVEMFIYETSQNIEQLEQSVVMSEAEGFTPVAVNEIMRNMHTIKGSAAMMMYTAVSTLAHAMEDLFFYLRERRPERVDYSVLSDLVLDGIDFIKVELHKIKAGEEADGDASLLIATIHEFLAYVKQTNETNETNEASAAEAPTARPSPYTKPSRFSRTDARWRTFGRSGSFTG
ncbi:Hpt domain-containing protein [Cohnella massiliensis]|uniref:Hpt domain-containing protein n=1 Tax=Cohnella massiliensis TaxID=1816691 RepID=UPI001BC8C901|nr:Hpt domain-containing protein [Cohnella massiliensis]